MAPSHKRTAVETWQVGIACVHVHICICVYVHVQLCMHESMCTWVAQHNIMLPRWRNRHGQESQ